MTASFIYIIIYNIIQWLVLLLLWPILALWILRPKYRGRIANRLGYDLPKFKKKKGAPRIWIHALSVGEAASSLPLITAIRRDIPQAEIIFSTTTKSGGQYAQRMTGLVDHFIPFPVDFYWTVRKFINHLTPDLFILIETDLWPNILWQMKARNITTILANGRITENSFKNYKRATFLFGPLFDSFSRLSMQVEIDAQNMIDLGVSAEKVIHCGNLKYDTEPLRTGPISKKTTRKDFRLPPTGPILVAGSTHKGEEEIIINAFKALTHKYNNMALIIAPRDIGRRAEIAEIIRHSNLTCNRRSQRNDNQKAILLLDTLGELAQVYTLADLAFVGGSLVAQGGHNPIEPAILGKTVIFGPYMEDFAEISLDLLQAKAAIQVTAENFTITCDKLLANKEQRLKLGNNAATLIGKNQGAAKRYIKIIQDITGHTRWSG